MTNYLSIHSYMALQLIRDNLDRTWYVLYTTFKNAQQRQNINQDLNI